MRAGLPLTQEILFSSGHPDGDITWSLYDETGQVIVDGNITPAPDAASAVIAFPGTYNQLASGVVIGWRDLDWTYFVNGVLHAARNRYKLEASPPFGASETGVRSLFGVAEEDLPDDEIPLVKAYFDFRHAVTAVNLDAVDPTDAYTVLAVASAIEATAALALLPSMQVRIAASESSGTNQYKRQDIDWDRLADHLNSLVAIGAGVVTPSLNTASNTSLLLLVTPATDLFPEG